MHSRLCKSRLSHSTIPLSVFLAGTFLLSGFFWHVPFVILPNCLPASFFLSFSVFLVTSSLSCCFPLTPSFLPHLLFCTDSLSDSKRGMQVLVCSLPSVYVISVWASVLWSKRVMFVFLCTDTARTVRPCVCVCVRTANIVELCLCVTQLEPLHCVYVSLCECDIVIMALSNRGVISCFYTTVSPSPLIWLAESCSKRDIKDLRRRQT